MTSRSAAATKSRSGSSASSTDRTAPIEQSEHSNNRTLIPRRQIAAEYAILFPAGCGGGCPATAGAIGWELGGRSPSSPPSTALSLALFRFMCSTEFLQVFKDTNVCLRKTRLFWARLSLGIRICSCRNSVECPTLDASFLSCASFTGADYSTCQVRVIWWRERKLFNKFSQFR